MNAPKEVISLFKNLSKTLDKVTGGMTGLGGASDKTKRKITLVPHSIDELNEKLEKLKKLKNKSFSTQAIKRYQTKISQTEKDIANLGKAAKKSGGFMNSMVSVTRMNQMLEVADKVKEKLSFVNEVVAIKRNIAISTGLVGEALDEAVNKTHELASVYQQDGDTIRQSANSLAKQMGMSFTDALSLIEKGFKTGADLNGDFLDQMKEYPAQMKEAGLSASQMISFISQAGKDGIYSDKALDSIKEAGLSLREMGQAQVDALDGVGLEPEDLVGKSSFEAVKLISEKMKDATTQAKQLVLADIFKGAGEDAGREFIEGLADQNLDLNTMQEFEKAGSGIQGFMANMESWVSNTMGSIGGSVLSVLPVISNLGMTFVGLMPLLEKYNVITKITTFVTKGFAIAQGILNAVMNLNPVVLIATAIIGLGTAMVWAYQKVDWFRGIIKGTWESLKMFGSLIWDNIIGALKKLLSGITGIGSALVSLFKGDFTEAWETGKKAVSDLANGAFEISPIGAVTHIVKNGEKIGKAFSKGYNEGVDDLATPEGEAISEKKQEATILPKTLQKQLNDPTVKLTLTPADHKNSKSSKTGASKVEMNLNFNIHQTFNEGKAQMKTLADQVAQVLTEASRTTATAL